MAASKLFDVLRGKLVHPSNMNFFVLRFCCGIYRAILSRNGIPDRFGFNVFWFWKYKVNVHVNIHRGLHGVRVSIKAVGRLNIMGRLLEGRHLHGSE
jgi:hypothetical protein